MTSQTTVPAEIAAIDNWWRTAPPRDITFLGQSMFRLAGTAHDQRVPAGVSNPYWEIVRHLPSLHDPCDGITPSGYVRGDGVGRNELTRRYSWSIPSPGDMRWLAEILDGRPLVEAAAGTGYWAWQAAQAGIDVIAYEPNEPAGNLYVEGREYFPLRRANAVTAATQHPDRALLMSWPSYGAEWAAEALAAYQGEVFVYAGEGVSGCCADDGFFDLLDLEWEEIGQSPHHLTWWGIHCRLTAYRRRQDGGRS